MANHELDSADESEGGLREHGNRPSPESNRTRAEALAEIPRIVAACHHQMGRPLQVNDLEDCVQDVALRALGRPPDRLSDDELGPWLWGIARLTILGRIAVLRRQRGRAAPGGSDATGLRQLSVPPRSAADTGLVRQVEQQLAPLDPVERVILERRQGQGESFVAIGQRLQMPASTVKTRYYRMIRALRIRLARVWETVGP